MITLGNHVVTYRFLSALSNRCSVRGCVWSDWRGTIPQHSDWKSDALPIELQSHKMKSETALHPIRFTNLVYGYLWLPRIDRSCATSCRLPLLGDINSKPTRPTYFIFCSQWVLNSSSCFINKRAYQLHHSCIITQLTKHYCTITGELGIIVAIKGDQQTVRNHSMTVVPQARLKLASLSASTPKIDV